MIQRFAITISVAVLVTARAPAAEPPVTIADDGSTYTLANGIVTAKVAKRSGDLVSLRFKDVELLSGGSGHPYAYWSHAATAPKMTQTLTIDPKSNGGERGEVSIKGISDGRSLGNGPGGSAVSDIEIRYTLGRGDSGVYTYSIWTHKPEYPATSVGEARFAAKLNPKVFDFMTVDAKRRKPSLKPEDWDQGTPLNMKEARRLNTGIYKGQVEHKYDYSAIQFDIPAFGWSSTEHKLGLWFVNPTIEYLSGGATKVELTAHLDNNAGAAPTVLNYWRGSHYGGSSCSIAQGEAWTKVIGPFLIYCNSAANVGQAVPDDAKRQAQPDLQATATHDAMWKDALARAKREFGAWPYDWVRGVDYPHKDERGTVRGQLVLNDFGKPDAKTSNLLVGLAAPDYTPRSGGGGRFGPRTVDWQNDAKYYQFWTRATGDRFSIPKVRPGKYTLHAIADGVLGEFAKTDIVVEPGQALDLGRLEWEPVRHGRQLWEIGIPNRSAEEFRHGDHYWQWGLYNLYDQEFPNDVNFVIGKSDCRTNWNYAQVPHADGRGSTWSVTFDLPAARQGQATLRLAIAGASTRSIDVTVNDQPAGNSGPLVPTSTINRDGIRGYWQEKAVTFDAALMKQGTNVLKLTIPRGGVMSGVMYDYIRLELDEPAVPTLFIVGDSTVKTGTRGQQGWGDPIAKLFDTSRIKVENHAIGGRSSRTFQTEGRWDRILAKAKPGDFVLIQMGHNDGGPLDDGTRARGSLPGLGDETREIDNPITRKKEIVHTYGWYMRQYVTDARAKGMIPIICSPIPHCPQKAVGPDEVEKSRYVTWSEEVAKSEKVPFVHLNKITMGHYASMTPAEVKEKYFTPADNTHTSPAGAERNAVSVVEGIRALNDCPLAKYLAEKPAQ
ncbi:MAG TPA: polysaccharide lyase family protein [Gemmataceae bacterium]|nr:polysaccharide lyase family protein [Gemmataceae bacterium]